LGGVDQAIFPGTSVQQIDAVVDLMMNYPAYTSGKNDISDLVKQGAVAVPAATEGAPAVPEQSQAAENEERPAKNAGALNTIQTR